MWKWLRSWFAWRFSLTRLVVAVLFLGAVVGLNMRKIGPREGQEVLPTSYWGWPFPFAFERDSHDLHVLALQLQYSDPRGRTKLKLTDEAVTLISESNGRRDAAKAYRLPLSHHTYRLIKGHAFPVEGDPMGFVIYGILDFLFAFTVLTLILFLHPRRKPPEPEGAQ